MPSYRSTRIIIEVTFEALPQSLLQLSLAAQGDSDEPPQPGDFHVPSRISLARTLFESWLAEA